MATCIFAYQKMIRTLTSCLKSVYSRKCEKNIGFLLGLFLQKLVTFIPVYVSLVFYLQQQTKILTINHSFFEKTVKILRVYRQFDLLFTFRSFWHFGAQTNRENNYRCHLCSRDQSSGAGLLCP